MDALGFKKAIAIPWVLTGQPVRTSSMMKRSLSGRQKNKGCDPTSVV
jgi:hypothetical protein